MPQPTSSTVRPTSPTSIRAASRASVTALPVPRLRARRRQSSTQSSKQHRSGGRSSGSTHSSLWGRPTSPNPSAFLAACVRARMNVVNSGGTSSGKTTLLGVLSSFVPTQERVITIEDAAELRLAQPHVVGLEARRDRSGDGPAGGRTVRQSTRPRRLSRCARAAFPRHPNHGTSLGTPARGPCGLPRPPRVPPPVGGPLLGRLGTQCAHSGWKYGL